MKKIYDWWKKLEVSNKIMLTGLFLTFMFTMWGFSRGCSQETKIEEINYKLNSISYQPRIVIVGEPIFTKFYFNPFGVPLEKPQEIIDSKNKMIVSDTVPSIEIRSKLKITNIGKSLGKIIYYVTSCRVEERENIREFILEKDLERLNFQKSKRFPEFLNTELLPNGIDTLELEFKSEISNMSEGTEFILHYIIFYENELGHFYDTYFRSKYEFIFTVPDPLKDQQILPQLLSGQPIKLSINNYYIFNKNMSKPTYYIYKKTESDDVRDLFELLKKN
jgi:hypothetical protein